MAASWLTSLQVIGRGRSSPENRHSLEYPGARDVGHRVVEMDPSGKTIWEAQIAQPMSATRLPNGNTLVTSQQWQAKIYELDHRGQVAKEMAAPLLVQRARRR